MKDKSFLAIRGEDKNNQSFRLIFPKKCITSQLELAIRSETIKKVINFYSKGLSTYMMNEPMNIGNFQWNIKERGLN